MKSALPKLPTSIVNLVITALKVYPRVFKRVLWLVVLSSVGHLIIPFLFELNLYFFLVACVGFILLTWFLYPVIMWLAEIEIEGGHMPFHAAYKVARQRYLTLLGSNIIFFGIGLFAALLIYALNLAFDLVGQHHIFLALSIGLSIYVFIMLYFAIPSIVMDKNVIIGSFYRSVYLVKDNWWRTFIPLALIALAILGFEALGILFTGKLRIFLFTGYHFIVQVIFYPLIVVMTLLLLNDLHLRYQRKHIGSQHVTAATSVK